MKTIDVRCDFSYFPGGRYRKGGENSGEEFRDDFLIPALREHDVVAVHLDGTNGYGSPFLEEAFGGAVRAGYRIDRKRLKVISEYPSRHYEIWEYIDREMERRGYPVERESLSEKDSKGWSFDHLLGWLRGRMEKT